MKSTPKSFCVFCVMSFVLTLTSSGKDISILDSVLSLSGQNRFELEKVLKYYSQDSDKEKLKAAQFLIENMQWHASLVPISKTQHPILLDSLTRIADSLYYSCVKNVPKDSIGTSGLENEITKVRHPFWLATKDRIKEDKFCRPTEVRYDYEVLTADELIRHIDHIFYLRKNVSAVRQLSFEDFCEYILPYRSISDFSLMNMPEACLKLLGKYLKELPQDSVSNKVNRYNFTLKHLKNFFPRYPYSAPIGYQELFFNGAYDCIPVAHYGASTFRMLGIPSAVEYNVAYKQRQGTHYMCSVLMPDGKWMDFSPESGIPSVRQNNDYKISGSMNVYRFMFAAQKDTPFFLHGEGEFIPEELNCPFIRDVSSRLLSTTSLQLPFNEACNNRLAYLATFSSGWDDGLVPVTWAEIDKKGKSVLFRNVVTERIYFPIYYNPAGESVVFSDPFYINRSGEKINISSAKMQKAELYHVTRKFPWKPAMKRRSEELIGTVVLASNNASLMPRDTVACISGLLQPCFQDIALDMSKGPYTYYRLQAPRKSPHLYLSEFQFLTNVSYHYTNTCAPDPLPIYQVGDTVNSVSTEVRLLDAPLEKTMQRVECDNNPQTSLSVYSTGNLRLKQLQYATKIRLMPIHADNGVVPGDTYKLLHWKDRQWEDLGEQTAKYNFLSFKIVKGDMYWLQNLTSGKEELPFIISKDGRQLFIYHDIMND